MESTHRTFRALVLRDSVYKEADKILTLLTENAGILTCKARGAMKSTSPLSCASQAFVFSEFTVYEFSNQLLVDKADPIEQFAGLRTDLRRYALAGYISELVEEMGMTDTPEDDSLYRLVMNTLYALANLPQIRTEKIKAAFELRLCADSGFAPELSSCGYCGESPREPVFSCEDSQLFCREHYDGSGKDLFSLTPRLLDAMRTITQGELRTFLSFRLTAEEGNILCRLAESYILQQMDCPESLKYYKSLRI